MEIDYKQLLEKYIDHVGHCEGVSFLNDWERGHPAGHGVEFTDAEWSTLQDMDKEIDERYQKDSI